MKNGLIVVLREEVESPSAIYETAASPAMLAEHLIWWAGQDSNLCGDKVPPDLQSGAISLSTTCPNLFDYFKISSHALRLPFIWKETIRQKLLCWVLKSCHSIALRFLTDTHLPNHSLHNFVSPRFYN
jgi:hypothetical protein